MRTKKKLVNFRIQKTKIDRFRQIAKNRGLTMTDLIDTAIDRMIREPEGRLAVPKRKD
jgi:antitoxin component of RelBE/YafQ-DinJ toxin-antitoxin module